MNKLDTDLYKQSCDLAPIGILILDAKKTILFWNNWLARKTNLMPSDVVNKCFNDIFCEVNNQRFDWAIEQVTSFGHPQVLSQILNKYVIPIKLQRKASDDCQFMPQHVEISPLKTNNGIVALVTILDVTESFVQKKTLFEKAYNLEDESQHDVLTNAYNRRFLMSWLAKELEFSKKNHSPIACCLVDLDRFKEINDQYGHELGDDVLKDFARLVLDELRATDILVRYGGEEFVIMLPGCSLHDAYLVAEKIRKKLEAATIATLKVGDVTCSIGVAVSTGSDPIDSAALLKKADQQMYNAKSNGRNQVCPVMQIDKE